MKDKKGGSTDRRLVFAARIHLPWRLIQKACELSVERAISGWQLNIRVYNVVPESSLVFRYAKEGDATGLRELFKNGHASPFDRDIRGHSTIWVGQPQLTG